MKSRAFLGLALMLAVGNTEQAELELPRARKREKRRCPCGGDMWDSVHEKGISYCTRCGCIERSCDA